MNFEQAGDFGGRVASWQHPKSQTGSAENLRPVDDLSIVPRPMD
jgi:hypothetical protein